MLTVEYCDLANAAALKNTPSEHNKVLLTQWQSLKFKERMLPLKTVNVITKHAEMVMVAKLWDIL